MRLTDKRQNITARHQRSTSKHSIASKSPPILPNIALTTTHKKKKIQNINKQNICSFNVNLTSATDTPEFTQDPSKFVYNCQHIYALLESVKIQRNFETTIQLIQMIRQMIYKLSKKKNLQSQISALQQILKNIQKKLGYVPDQKSQIDTHRQTTAHYQIQFSLISNWKQMTGKDVIYTNFSLVDDDQSINTLNSRQQKQATLKHKYNKFSQQSNTSNGLITDLNLEIQMLDSLLQGKLKKRPRVLNNSTASETIRKNNKKKVFY